MKSTFQMQKKILRKDAQSIIYPVDQNKNKETSRLRHPITMFLGMILLYFFIYSLAHAARIKDIATIEGLRSNQLVGYGLVVGLDGTGDASTNFTAQSFKSMLKQFGIIVPNKISDLKNVAAVALSANLPPLIRPGQKIDVTVSSIGSAKSLRGGTLLMSPMKGADGQVYAIAQGDVIVSGLGAKGADGSKIAVNIASVGRILGGATVERTVPSPYYTATHLNYMLNHADFTTAKRTANEINQVLGTTIARPLDSGTIQVNIPKNGNDRVEFISMLENIDVTPDEGAARIIVNARTGTIIIGQRVVVKPAAITHGNLTVTITETPVISQPNPLSTGKTVAVKSSSIKISESDGRMFILEGSTLKDIVQAINAVGAAPGDLMAIIEALKEVGSIDAEISVI